MQLVKAASSSHWYKQNNGTIEAFYEIEKKSGGGMRAPNVTDARELKLLPSVTSIIGILDKPQLTAWKVTTGIMAALTLPRVKDEPLDAFAKRVVTDMEQQSKDARDLGSACHNAIEQSLLDTSYVVPPTVFPYVENTLDLLKTSMVAFYGAEQIVACPELGYAGKLDLYCRLRLQNGTERDAVVDFKTQGVKRDKNGKPRASFYEDWSLQLAAYGKCKMNGGGWPLLCSIVIDTAQPGPCYLKFWEEPDLYWQMFQHCFALWCWQKDYNPAQQ